jgi:butyryl-CoA dehydrogenase
VQNSLYCDPVYRFGSEEQKKNFLTPFARGERIGCYALTEPQVGSNAAALRTLAARKGGDYIVNGTKAWISPTAALRMRRSSMSIRIPPKAKRVSRR